MTVTYAGIFSSPVSDCCCCPNILLATCYHIACHNICGICCLQTQVAHCKPNTVYLLMLSLTAGAAALMAAQYPSLSVTNMKASMLASVTPVAGLTGYCQTNVSLTHSHNYSCHMQLVCQASQSNSYNHQTCLFMKPKIPAVCQNSSSLYEVLFWQSLYQQ